MRSCSFVPPRASIRRWAKARRILSPTEWQPRARTWEADSPLSTKTPDDSLYANSRYRELSLPPAATAVALSTPLPGSIISINGTRISNSFLPTVTGTEPPSEFSMTDSVLRVRVIKIFLDWICGTTGWLALMRTSGEWVSTIFSFPFQTISNALSLLPCIWCDGHSEKPKKLYTWEINRRRAVFRYAEPWCKPCRISNIRELSRDVITNDALGVQMKRESLHGDGCGKRVVCRAQTGSAKG